MFPVSFVVAAAIGCCGVGGTVRSADGVPLHAHVHMAGPASADAESDTRGAFTLTVVPGAYRVTITAPGYTAAESDVVVHDGERIDATLEPVGAGRLRQIGRVTVDGRLAIPRTMVPTRDVSRADLDASGYDRAVDALGDIPSVTLTRPDGGSAVAPTVISLRGPDPSETRIALDGQPLNNTNTGDVDLALFPTAVLSGLEVSEGLGPQDDRGSDTIGGEVNLLSLRPTATPQGMLRLSTGSFNTSTVELNATGHVSRLGYALAAGDGHSDGYVHDYPVSFDGIPVRLGSGFTASTALVNLTYDLTPRATLRLRTFTADDVRDESAAQTVPALQANGLPGSDAPGAVFSGSGPQTRSQSIRATLVGATLPLGAGSLSATTTLSSIGTSLDRPLATIAQPDGVTPYDFSPIDRLAITTLEWTHATATSSFSAGGQARAESLLSPDQFNETLREHADVAWLRASTDVGPRVTLAGGIVESKWSTFAASTDGRIGISVDDGSNGTFRFAVGTGFRPPLLAERYTLPLADLAPDQNCVGLNGNPNEHAEHATEYELGYGKRLGATTLDATLYRTNLRDPIENFYPLGTTCPIDAQGNPVSTVVAQSFPINVGSVVYQGGTLRLSRRFGEAWFGSAEYGVNAAYPTQLPDVVAANPTSGSNLVVGEQFAGIPLQEFSLGLRYAHGGMHGALNLTATSTNNWLAQGRFATLDAAVGKRWNHVDLTLAGTNLTNAVSGRFTRLNLGTPYPTPFGLESRDALVLDPAAFRLIVTLR